jgi:formate dehydrogenase iron-sulfur subunit
VAREPTGFFTDVTLCIGCKACEVACKEWNQVPDDGFAWSGLSYDHTRALGPSTWRHVKFVEQQQPLGAQTLDSDEPFRWVFFSDVCKHCAHAGCLEVCPTGSIMRNEFGAVYVQPDVCNGCGYCVVACPFGVIGRRPGDGRAFKCTLCYDRLKVGETPACAKACPTESIQYGDLDELRERANDRVAKLHEAGIMDARLYGNDPNDGVGGAGAFVLLLDEPEVYGFPPDPVVTTKDLPHMFNRATAAALTMLAGAAISFLGRRG